MGASVLIARGAAAAPEEGHHMYGLIGSMTAAAGHRDDLIAILTQAVAAMPGCLSYIVAKDSKDEKTIWITEVWLIFDSLRLSVAVTS